MHSAVYWPLSAADAKLLEYEAEIADLRQKLEQPDIAFEKENEDLKQQVLGNNIILCCQ